MRIAATRLCLLIFAYCLIGPPAQAQKIDIRKVTSVPGTCTPNGTAGSPVIYKVPSSALDTTGGLYVCDPATNTFARQGASAGMTQAADADLTAIAGLSPSNDDFIQRKSGAWTYRTPAQVKVDLAVQNLVADLAAKQSTLVNSAGLATALSDETGSGPAVLGNSPTISAPALTVRTQANNAAIVANSIYRNTTNHKLYIGSDDGLQNNELFEGGVSLVNLESNVTGRLPGASVSGLPLDVAFNYVGAPATSATFRYVAARAFDLASSFSGTVCSAGTAATAQTDFLVKVNGTTKATLRFAASGTTCSIVSGTTTSVVATDVITVVAPASADGTLADIAITLKGVIP